MPFPNFPVGPNAYIILYENGQPAEILFAGYSFG